MSRVLPLALLLVACGANTETSELDGGSPDAHSSDGGLPDAAAHDASPTPNDGGPDPDAEVADAAEHPTEGVEIGTGWENFIALSTGGAVDLIAGPQGGSPFYGFHIWISARADTSYRADGAQLKIDVLQADTGTSIIANGEYQFDLTPVSGGAEVTGMRAVLRNCCDAENRDLLLTLELTDQSGKVGHDRRTVRTSGPCRDPLNPNYDPCP